MKLGIVSMVEINGERVRQEDIPPEDFKEIVREAITRGMNNIGFKLIKTA